MTASKPPAEGTPSNHVVKVEFFSDGALLTKYADGTDELFDANPATRWLQRELKAERRRCEGLREENSREYQRGRKDEQAAKLNADFSWKDRAVEAESRAASANACIRDMLYFVNNWPTAEADRIHKEHAAAIDAASGEAG